MKQKISLERCYMSNAYPDPEARQQLARDLGMSARKVKTVTVLIELISMRIGSSLVSEPQIKSQVHH
jgi:hypothetical protein